MFVQGWRRQAQTSSEISAIHHRPNDTTHQDSRLHSVLSQIAAVSLVILSATLLMSSRSDVFTTVNSSGKWPHVVYSRKACRRFGGTCSFNIYNRIYPEYWKDRIDCTLKKKTTNLSAVRVPIYQDTRRHISEIHNLAIIVLRRLDWTRIWCHKNANFGLGRIEHS
jgi:hypothetical protein